MSHINFGLCSQSVRVNFRNESFQDVDLYYGGRYKTIYNFTINRLITLIQSQIQIVKASAQGCADLPFRMLRNIKEYLRTARRSKSVRTGGLYESLVLTLKFISIVIITENFSEATRG